MKYVKSFFSHQNESESEIFCPFFSPSASLKNCKEVENSKFQMFLSLDKQVKYKVNPYSSDFSSFTLHESSRIFHLPHRIIISCCRKRARERERESIQNVHSWSTKSHHRNFTWDPRQDKWNFPRLLSLSLFLSFSCFSMSLYLCVCTRVTRQRVQVLLCVLASEERERLSSIEWIDFSLWLRHLLTDSEQMRDRIPGENL